MSHTEPFHRPAVAAALGMLVTLTAACTGPGSATSSTFSCADLRTGEPTSSLMLLTDGQAPAFARAIDALEEDADSVFSSPDLGFAPVDADEATAGTVVLASYGDDGTVTVVGEFNLAGTGNDETRRRANARSQAQCLRAAADQLPPAPASGTTDLLRTLETAAEEAAHQDPPGGATVAAFGLGRSSIGGTPLDQVDLSPSGQTAVFDELGRVGLVPDLSSADVALRLIDPGADVPNAISAAAVESFALALCERVGVDRCTSGSTLD